MNISKIQKFFKDDRITILTYDGLFTQELISSLTEILEKETEKNKVKLGMASNIFTVFIELSQNILNYSTDKHTDEVSKYGLLIISKDIEGSYYIISQNIVRQKDKEYIDSMLCSIVDLEKDELRNKYREFRRSGKNSHSKGAGIGFFEIAKRSDKIEYEFETLSDNKIQFTLKTIIRIKKAKK